MTTTPPPPSAPLRRAVRRVVITVAGTAVVAAGIAMLVLPGPGLVTIALGLSLLGREHAWAAALEQRARARLVAATRRVRDHPRGRTDEERIDRPDRRGQEATDLGRAA